MTASSSDYSDSPQLGNTAASDVGVPNARRLDAVRARGVVEVLSVDGEDAVSERLAASGIWAGAVLEHIASASFGGPLLFRVHGYRLALRRSEAQRVRVVESQAVGVVEAR